MERAQRMSWAAVSGVVKFSVSVRASHPAPGSALTSVWAPGWRPRPELAHKGYRSRPSPGQTQWLTLSFNQPEGVTLPEGGHLHLRFPAGFAPQELSVWREGSDGEHELLCCRSMSAQDTLALPPGPIHGLRVVQTQGHPEHPHQLGLDALWWELPSKPGLRVGLALSSGEPWWPPGGMWEPDALHAEQPPLDLSDAVAILFDPRDATGARLRLSFERLGALGSPAHLRPWLDSLGCAYTLKTEELGIVGGQLGVELTLDDLEPAPEALFKLVLPGREHLLALRSARLLEARQPLQATPPRAVAAAASVGELGHAAPEVSAGDIRAFSSGLPLRFSASLGVPGFAGRVGVCPMGTLQWQASDGAPGPLSRGRCLHARAAIGGDAPSWEWQWQSSGPRRRWEGQDLVLTSPGLSQRLSPGLVQGRPWLRWELEAEKGPLTLGLAYREDLRRLPLDLALVALVAQAPGDKEGVEGDACLSLRGGGGDGASLLIAPKGTTLSVEQAELRLALPGRRATLWLPLRPAPSVAHDRGAALVSDFRPLPSPPIIRFQLPDPEQERLIRDLHARSPLWLQGGYRASYGVFPSVYAEMTFGLEEDWLFQGLALWGASATRL